jgi:hypothetical protein
LPGKVNPEFGTILPADTASSCQLRFAQADATNGLHPCVAREYRSAMRRFSRRPGAVLTRLTLA